MGIEHLSLPSGMPFWRFSLKLFSWSRITSYFLDWQGWFPFQSGGYQDSYCHSGSVICCYFLRLRSDYLEPSSVIYADHQSSIQTAALILVELYNWSPLVDPSVTPSLQPIFTCVADSLCMVLLEVFNVPRAAYLFLLEVFKGVWAGAHHFFDSIGTLPCSL